jgi:hypothetical protein
VVPRGVDDAWLTQLFFASFSPRIALIDDQFDEAPEYDTTPGYNIGSEAEKINAVKHDVHFICHAFDDSREKKQLKKDLAAANKAASKKAKKSTASIDSGFVRGFLYQTFTLVKRMVLLYIKNPTIFWYARVLYCFVGDLGGEC